MVAPLGQDHSLTLNQSLVGTARLCPACAALASAIKRSDRGGHSGIRWFLVHGRQGRLARKPPACLIEGEVSKHPAHRQKAKVVRRI
jgi:hypothetical protein